MEAEGGYTEHAGVWVRARGVTQRRVYYGYPALVLAYLTLGFEGDKLFSTSELAATALLTAVTVLLWVNWSGRTPGKRLLKIRVVSYPDYQPFSYGTALIRGMLGVASALTLVPYLVIVVMIALRDDKRGFHDIVAKTCVIRDR